MSISIFISSNEIQILSGQSGQESVQIHDIYHITPENGVMVNGVLVNEEEVKALIEETWEKYDLSRKDVKLMVESTQFRSRKILVPKKMSEKERLQLIVREFEVPEEEENAYLYDYMILGDEEEGELILGMMVEKEIVQGYIDFFAEMDITVTCIRNHLAGMMRVVRSLSEVNTKTCIILKMMGDSLGSILLDAGHYKNYMQRRLFHVHGTEEFAMEIGKHVNNTLQFQAGADQNAVTDIYFCGFTEEDRDCCQEMMEMVGYPIRKLKEGKIAKFPSASHCFMDEYREPCIGTYIGSVGNLLSPVGHELNFCNQLAADQKREEKEAKKAKMRKILPPVLLIAFCILVVAVMFGYRLYLSNRLQAANDYINDESNLAQEKKEDEILEETQKLQTEWNQITEAKENLATYPDADSKLLTMVSNLAKKYSVTAEVSSYSSESGVLVIEARSSTEKNIHQYIKALEQKTDTFSKVDYSGYVLNSETGIYTINVNGQLKAKEKE